MGESICVNISGPAFSLLLYENIRNEYDQEGFLLGEIITKEKRTITDNDQEVINIERIIKINSVMPCPNMAHFYDSCGRINKKKIKTFLGDQLSKVVSWYKFKHTPSFKLTLREKIILKQLATFLSPKATEHFLCCLLTTQAGSDSGATHLFSQTFIRYNNPVFQSLPMHIVNLKDPHDVYKSPEDCSSTFKNLVKSLRIDTKKTQGYTIVSKVEKALDGHISKVVEDLSEAEKKMYDLEQEVKRLRKKLTIMHDCGDFEDVFGILENGESSEQMDKASSSSSSAMDVTYAKCDENAEDATNRTKKGKSIAKTAARVTRNTVAKNSSTSIQDSTNTTKSYAQAMQKNKT